MDFGSISIVVALVGVVVALVRIVEHLILRKKNGNGGLTSEQKRELDKIFSFLTRYEIEWEYHKKTVSDVTNHTATTNTRIGELASVLEKLTDRQERLLERIGDLVDVLSKQLTNRSI